MSEPVSLVCPRCGADAGQGRFCSSCGYNLNLQPELLGAEERAARPREEPSLNAQGSPQQVAIAADTAPLAGWWLRVGARTVDTLILLMPIGFAVLFGVVGVFISLGIVFAYSLLMVRDGERNGQTLGKQAVGIRLRRIDSGVVDVQTVVIRELLAQGSVGAVATLLTYLTSDMVSIEALFLAAAAVVVLYGALILDGLWPLWDKKHRALHDMVARTHVVKEATSAR